MRYYLQLLLINHAHMPHACIEPLSENHMRSQTPFRFINDDILWINDVSTCASTPPKCGRLTIAIKYVTTTVSIHMCVFKHIDLALCVFKRLHMCVDMFHIYPAICISIHKSVKCHWLSLWMCVAHTHIRSCQEDKQTTSYLNCYNRRENVSSNDRKSVTHTHTHIPILYLCINVSNGPLECLVPHESNLY